MQTFLPYTSFQRSAEVLDDLRLGKQRVEALQILRAAHFPDYGWRHHPAVTMWRGFREALVAYGWSVVLEWRRRGFEDTTAALIAEFAHPEGPRDEADLSREGRMPPWWGWEAMHRSHRSALVRKDPGHYLPFFPGTPPDLPYVWPASRVPRAEPGEVSAWVVRQPWVDDAQPGAPLASLASDVLAVPALPRELRTAGSGVVTAGNGGGRVVPGWSRRQGEIERFRAVLRIGDVVVVPAGRRVLVGIIRGGYRWHPAADGVPQHQRPVTWVAELPRSALSMPAALQNPQLVFPLYDEPGVVAAAAIDLTNQAAHTRAAPTTGLGDA